MMFQTSRSRSSRHQQDIIFAGCTLEPMAAYLKALGLLRVVAQLDPQAMGRWDGSRFILKTTCSPQDIINFFLLQYSPSPACSPWNGTSGFWKKAPIVEQLLAAENPRFSKLRSLYATAKEFVMASGLKRQPEKAEKVKFIQDFQDIVAGQLADTEAGNQWQEWFLAVVVEREIVTKKSVTRKFDMPKLLGTGGNIGNADLGFCFAQAIAGLWDLNSGVPLAKCEERIRSGLFGELHSHVLDSTGLTQFHPASDFYTEYREQRSKDYAHAGMNSTAASNPFDLVLAIEGLFLFSGMSCREVETVESTTSHYSLAVSLNTALDPSSASDEVRGQDIEEIWLPVWENFVTAQGLREALFERGRNRLSRQPIRDSIDFAAEVSQWGADRTIDRFVRYGFLNRKGQANFSVSLGQFRPIKGLVDFAAELRPYRQFMKRFCRRKEATPKLEALFNCLESSIFNLLGSNGRVIDVLTAIGALESYISNSGEIGEDTLPSPCPTLSSKWVAKALQEDSSPEARLALSLASCQLRSQLFRVSRSEQGWWKWDESVTSCWINGSPIQSLLKLQQHWELNGKPSWFIPALPCDVGCFIQQDAELGRFEELLRGFALCSFKDFSLPAIQSTDYFISPLYVLCSACVWGDRRDGIEGKVAEHTQMLVRWLSLNQPDRAGEQAIRLLRSAGYCPKVSLSGSFRGADFNRVMAASLAFPLTQYQIDHRFSRFL
ncbi:type I-U CRISPR-associated protein Csx17 [Pantanalinema rosaneae CENA516]|uniref:type I-G CRISPR-associated protein Cas8g1/Csx17 n=1 Tax=Pantanalinema rosaneae TaxID=1620701 RepID=UPI003D6DA9D1